MISPEASSNLIVDTLSQMKPLEDEKYESRSRFSVSVAVAERRGDT